MLSASRGGAGLGLVLGRARRGHVLVLLLEFLDDPLDPVGLVDQPVLLPPQRIDDFVMRLRRLAERLVLRGDDLLRMELPFLRTSSPTPNSPGMSNERGLSDLSVIAGWRAYNTPEYALLVGAVGTFPTATEPALGFGKYTVGPAIATARFLPRLESFLIGLLSYQTSVGGDPSRKDVSFLNITAQVNSFWGQRWWTIVQSVWQVDFERSGKSSMVMEFEGGRNLIGRLGAYVRPGVGIYGRDVTGAYNWNIEVGVRYMFASF